MKRGSITRRLRQLIALNEMLPPEMQCREQIGRWKSELARMETGETFKPIGDAANRVVDKLSRGRS